MLRPETRNQLFELTKAHIKGRYERSVLGMLWYILGPLLFYAALLLIFRHRLGAGIEYYPLYLLIGVITWNAFVSVSGAIMRCIEVNHAIVKSLPLSPQLFVYSAALAHLIPFLVEFVIIAIACAVLGTGAIAPISALMSIVLLALFGIGVGYVLLSTYSRMRDVSELWSFIARLWWFVTPIVYVLRDDGPGEAINVWNPMFHIIDILRSALIYGHTSSPMQWLIAGLQAGGMFVIGLLLFKVVQYRMAEHV